MVIVFSAITLQKYAVVFKLFLTHFSGFFWFLDVDRDLTMIVLTILSRRFKEIVFKET